MYKDKTLPVEQRVNDLMARMTVAEKIGQVNQIPLRDDLDAMKSMIKSGSVGSIVLCFTPQAGRETQKGEAAETRRALQRAAIEESRLGIPLILGRDVIHGHHTISPIPLAQAASWDTDVARECSRVMSAEAYNDCVHWTFAPMMDIARDPRWGRVIEGFGEDPYLASAMAASASGGVREGGMAGCAKHYIGYGASEGGRDYNGTDIPDYSLYNVYLPPFRAAVKAGVQTVMSSFNDINGEPVTSSRKLLNDLLKEKCGFDGFIVSDWGTVDLLVRQGVAQNAAEAAEMAFNAGLDMDMCTGYYVEQLPALLESGKVSAERLDDAVRRILRVKFELGLFENPYGGTESAIPAEHSEAVLNAAKRSMVLLKNDKNTLPLRDKNIKIAVIGPMAEHKATHLGSWTMDGKPENVVSIAEGLRKAAPDAEIITAGTLYDDMLMAVRRADVTVVALGESRERNGEIRSVADIELTPDQRYLIESVAAFGRPVVAVVCAGRPLGIGSVMQHSDSVLYAWQSGLRAGDAIAAILLGRENPSGKLPITFPRSSGQIPVFYNHRRTGRDIDEYYGTNEYVNYEDAPGSPLFPFGFGLSYTKYEYSAVRADKTSVGAGESVAVQAEVSNTGTMAGEEVVQCYIGRKHAAVIQPVRELKGFARVHLAAGETKTVTFTFAHSELGFYMPDGTYTVPSGEYNIWIGADSLTANIVKITVQS